MKIGKYELDYKFIILLVFIILLIYFKYQMGIESGPSGYDWVPFLGNHG